MKSTEQYKSELEGVLPKDEYAGLTRADRTIPNQLLKNFSNIPADATGDLFGQIYEYFLAEFARSEGQKGGEFFTPRSVVRLMVEMIEPHGGRVFDPACGSGGMFVQSGQLIAEHRKELRAAESDVYVCGQEKTRDTVNLAKMNLAVNGLRGDVRQANTYYEDPFNSYGTFDYVLANPPFNVDDVSLSSVEKGKRFNAYGVPRNKSKAKKSQQGKETVPNANYLWINLFATSLKPKGRAALVMANSASDARHSEAEIRQRLIKENLIYATITSLYEACKLEILGSPIVRTVAVFQYLRGVIDVIIEQKDIDAVGLRIGQLLDESLVVDKAEFVHEHKHEYRIVRSGKTWDLSKIDFERLKEDFQRASYKNIEIADLRAFIQHKLDQMLRQNATRTDFAQRLQKIIDAYHAGSSLADNYFDELVKFAQDLKEESERHIREGLTEDELELFDLLKKDKMTKEETQKVRLAAKSLLHRLLEESPKVLVQDWYKDSQSKRKVQSAVEEILNTHLPDSYDRVVFKEKCDNVFDLILNYAIQGIKWAA